MSKRPNILFIHADQHRADCMGVENHPVLETPTMDNLANSGVRFSRFYAACPSCIAVRRSLMTGQSPQRHGLVGYSEGVLIPDNVPTLPGVLAQHGYQTYHVGRSMHQSPPRKLYGFHDMEIMTSPAKGCFCDYGDWFMRHRPEGSHDKNPIWASGIMHNDWTAEPWQLPDRYHPTTWAVDRALRFVERRDPTLPYFLSVGFIAPHPPLNPPAFYFDRYMRTGVPDPVIGDWAEAPDMSRLENSVAPDVVNLSSEAMRCARAAYYGSINHIDTQMRRMLNGILGISSDPNLVTIYTSDHGEMLGDHYGWRKSRPYECCARVPFLMRIPDHMGRVRNVVCDHPVTHADIMPTILEMLDIDIPDTVDGTSFFAQTRGENPATPPAPIHIEHTGYPHALTDGKLKFVWMPESGEEQFFDLTCDPEERHNAIADAKYASAIDEWRQQLIARLEHRPERFVVDGKLRAGVNRPVLIPGSQAETQKG